MRECKCVSWKYVGYVKNGTAAVSSFKKAHVDRTAVATKKRKKGSKPEIPPPVSKGAQQLLSIANIGQFNVSAVNEHAATLKGPVVHTLAAKTFQELAKIKGVSQHFKWLTKQLEGDKHEDDCYISPFPSKVGLEIQKSLQKHVADYRPALPGNGETQVLRDKLRDIAVSKSVSE
jgi:hypothetical protein